MDDKQCRSWLISMAGTEKPVVIKSFFISLLSQQTNQSHLLFDNKLYVCRRLLVKYGSKQPGDSAGNYSNYLAGMYIGGVMQTVLYKEYPCTVADWPPQDNSEEKIIMLDAFMGNYFRIGHVMANDAVTGYVAFEGMFYTLGD